MNKKTCPKIIFFVRCFVLLLLVLQAGAGRAQENAETVQRVVLTDGVRLLMLPRPDADTVAMTLFVRMERDTSPDDALTGALVARAFLYGNENRSFDSIAQTVRTVGGRVEILHTPDYVAVTLVTTASRLRDAGYLLAQALKNATMSRDALDRAAKDIMEARKTPDGDGITLAFEAAQNAALPYPPAEERALQRVLPEAAQDYFRSRYLPERTTLALVGNFVPAQARKTLDNFFFDFDRKPTRPVRLLTAAPPAFRSSARETLENAFGPLSYAAVAANAPSVTSPDYPAFLVLHTLLGAGHASRLFRHIRDTQGIGYEVNALYRPEISTTWTAYLQWDAARSQVTPEDALKRLNAELDGIANEPPTEAEISRARSLAVGLDALRHERVRETAFLLNWYETMGVGAGFDADLPRRIAAVKREDVLRVAKTAFASRHEILVVPPGRSAAH